MLWGPVTEKQYLESRMQYFENAGIPVQGYAFDNDARNRRLMEIVQLDDDQRKLRAGGIALVSVGVSLLALGAGMLASEDDSLFDYSEISAPFLIGGAGCTLTSVVLFRARNSTTRRLKATKAQLREEFMVR